MEEINNTDIPLEEKLNVDNQSQAIKKISATDTKLSSHALKSLLFFGSTGALIFFGLLAILPGNT
jgi:hypothetical protein